MSYQNACAGWLEYDRCHYGSSRLTFRGPYRIPKAVDVAILGGTETFGKFVASPFPALLENQLGRPVVNLGAANAGLDSFATDPIVEEVAQRARIAVLQVMGAHSVSNAFFRVHPRRNDRLIGPTDHLLRLFPEIDFAECTFTRHLLMRLQATCPVRTGQVVAELRKTWIGQMHDLIARLAMPTILLWVSDRPPAPPGLADQPIADGDPLFVTREMVFQIAGTADAYVEVAHPFGAASDMAAMTYPATQRPAAARLPGPSVHASTASALARVIVPFLEPTIEPFRKSQTRQ